MNRKTARRLLKLSRTLNNKLLHYYRRLFPIPIPLITSTKSLILQGQLLETNQPVQFLLMFDQMQEAHLYALDRREQQK